MKSFSNKDYRYACLNYFAQICIFLCSLFILFSSPSHAEDFTAKTLSDQGNITVMEVSGNYDAKKADGSYNDVPRQVIAKEFLKTHKDEYDFLVIFSNFDFQMPAAEAKAFYLSVKNDTKGIGQQLFDNSTLFGSNGKLQGMVDMGNVSQIIADPINPKFEDTLFLLSHEMMHRWGAYVKFKDANGNISTALLGKDLSHWSYLLNGYGSVLYGNQWQDNGNGTFTSIANMKYYSPLDLYLMGLYSKTQVPPMLLIANPDIDPAKIPQTGETINGTPQYITIDDIVAAEGEHIPASSEAQKTFKTAFIFITAPGTFTGDELYGIEGIRNGWVTRFSINTDGKAIVDVDSTPAGNLPSNPGTATPAVTPRTLPPNIEDGVNWLMANQKTDGSWMDLSQTSERDTAQSVLILKNFSNALQNYSTGIQWLSSAESGNMDYLSRKIETLANSGQDVTSLVNGLVSRQNTDGGWGSDKAYMSNPLDTALALKALSKAGYSGQGTISKAIDYLKASQNADKGWGGDDGESTVETTSNVLAAFNKFSNVYQLNEIVSGGIALLLQHQNPDGGFGNSPSTVYDTAIAVSTLKALDVSDEFSNKAVNYMLGLQSEDGSWYKSAYQTALAVNAVWEATVNPDLSVKPSDITFTPSSVSSLPADIVVNAGIANLGRTDVAQAKVVLYDGTMSSGKKIGEQVIAVLGQSSAAAQFPVLITDGSEHLFHVYVDPENLVQEPNKTNNTALNIFKPDATYDFEVLSSNLTVSPGISDIFKDVKISSKVTNSGTINAYNVQIKYYIDEAGVPFEIATSTADVPANSTISNEITWKANKAGANLPVTVYVDPFNNFTEVSKDNNKASAYLTVNGATGPNLTVSYKDMLITPSPANEKGNANITAIVKNEGFSAASNITVNCYRGVPGVDGVLLGTRSIPLLDQGESASVSFDWTNINESGEKIVYIKVDPESQITEIAKDDNDAFVVLKILNLPDLTLSTNSIVFTPSAPKNGDVVSISVTVQNKGEQAASNVLVRAYEGNAEIGSQVVPSIAGNSFAGASIPYDTTGKKGAHQVTIVIDPDNAVAEQSKDNNSASRTFGVQDSNLWLTEQYISPNGDGVKDSTQVFFSLDTPQTVKVVVTNGKGEDVRTFSGVEFDNTPGGNITWDGLNDKGSVVADGQYQAKVVDMNNNILGSLLVIVDTDRSPLADAVGSKYFLNNNLSCKLPGIPKNNWEWFPDESGILFYISSQDTNYPEYPTGLYTMTPDGEDVLRLTPTEWNLGTDPKHYYYYKKYRLSPDGRKTTFILEEHNTLSNKHESQLWIVENNGTDLHMVASVDLVQDYNPINDVKWSPNGEYLIYKTGNPANLWVISPDGTGKTKIDSGGEYLDFKYLGWMPGGNRIFYVYDYYDADWNYIQKVRITDISGAKEDLFTLGGEAKFLDRLGSKKLVLRETYYTWGDNLWLIDAGGQGDNINIAEFPAEFSISPDKGRMALIEIKDDKIRVKLSDNDGNLSVLHEVPYMPMLATETKKNNLSNLIWSSNGEKIAFVEHKKVDDCSRFEPHLITADLAANTVKDTKAGGARCDYTTVCSGSGSTACNINEGNQFKRPVSFFPGNDDLLLEDKQGYFVIDTGTGDIRGYLPVEGSNPAISALAHYITYYQSVDQSGACYKGSIKSDLWSARSLLNLTAYLNVKKEESAVALKGTASDLNFAGARLEYADIKNPDSWNPVGLPSNVPVINDLFTMWVPPYEGIFYVRLTVWDEAGNTAVDEKRVSWGLSSGITNIFKTLEQFSPNGDGTKDMVELHYRVLGPAHLEFNVYDENDYPVNTFLKDYTSSVDDFITWDGRDIAGNIVPDGKYKIKVFDYDFFVVVDNTPPDVTLALTDVKQDLASNMFYSEMYGHVVDAKLKNWVLEYGFGDNPQEWHEFRKGAEQLVGKDDEGNPVLGPVKDDTLETFKQEGAAWLAGKSFRITAEDFAGNKSTVITNLHDEKIILNEWDGDFIRLDTPDRGSLSPINTWSGVHSIGGLNTISVPMASMSLQFRQLGDTAWTDTQQITDPASAVIGVKWDNSGLDPAKGYDVRIKAVDIAGLEHYSNELLTGYEFLLWAESGAQPHLWKKISLFEDLKLLKFQVRSSGDSRFTQWTDYSVQWSETGGDIVQGEWLAPLPDGLLPGIKYDIMMLGTGMSGKTYTASGQYPLDSQNGISLAIDYEESGCGMISGKALLSMSIKDVTQINGKLESLSYYIQKQDGLQLLRQIDLSKEGLGGMKIDTADMAEGSYPVKAVLKITGTDGNKRELFDIKTLVVDRTLPSAKITYPAKSAMVCPVKFSNPKGDWYGISLEGMAMDNVKVKKVELYYGQGETPAMWLPAQMKEAKTASGAGQLGVWDITKIKETDLSLRIKVTDSAGNMSCSETSFFVKNSVEIPKLSSDMNLLSPNGDGILDNVSISYEIDEHAVVDVSVYPALQADDGSYVLDETAWVTDVAYGLDHAGGIGNQVWDGNDYWGEVVPDGKYGIAVYAKDSCGNAAMKWVPVEVDNIPPSAQIVYPGPSDPLGNIVEVKGTADDVHFRDYVLEAGQGDNPSVWNIIVSDTVPVKDKVLGNWNTFGLLGKWTLRLTASDTVGNTNTFSVTVDLGTRKNLVKDFNAAPKLFSPNNDGKLDSAVIKYELTDACLINIDIKDSSGTLRKTYGTATPSGGMFTYTWDGKDNAGNVVPDDVYTVGLSAALSYNLAVTQSESLTVAVDSNQPVIDIKKPESNSYINTDVTVNGTVSDKNLLEYSINYSGDSGNVLVDKGNQNRENFTFGVITDLPEGNYTLNIRAKDLAENSNEKNIPFVIDRTPPKVALETPKEGEYFGADRNSVNVSGSIVEKNLESFSLRYGTGDDPAQWTDLASGNVVPSNSQIFSWKVGKNDGVPDGLYTLSLFAKDKSGSTGETKVKITVDNTQPEVAITSQKDGDYIRAAADIKGTAADPGLDKYTVEISEGQCGSAFKWTLIKTSAAQVKNGLLASWQMVPPDGDYCIRLSGIDLSGNKAETRVNVKVDTHPPAPPVLSGKTENKSVVRLSWAQNTDADLSGYDIYRNGQKVNQALIKGIDYLDQDLKEGEYTYALKAVDFAGNESLISNEIKLKVDFTGPDAKINSPKNTAKVSGLIDIKGTAYSSEDFKQYRVYIGQGQDPSGWALIRTSPLPVPYGLMAQWDTAGLAEGTYFIKLEAEDLSGNINTYQVAVAVDNTSPAAPVLVSVSPDGSNVTLSWQANAEADLAGYLLFRNDQIANVSGIVMGDLAPYLITATTYTDKTLPDGKFKYYLMAMDQAGNLSDRSNALEVSIDTRAPHAVIVEPADKSKFEYKTLFKSESPDTDIASVQFQYKRAQDSSWINLGDPAIQSPYITYIDPKGLGLTQGDYHVRAIATDNGGKTDPSPSYITVTFTDITAPSVPSALKASAAGKDVALTWTADTEADLDGYNVYRTSKGAKTKVNSSVVKEAVFLDKNLSDGEYAYEVTAVDTSGNESKPSNSASAKIYSLQLTQQYTPTGLKNIKIQGAKAADNTYVEIFSDTGSGPASQGSTLPNSLGNFEFDLELLPGENRITAKAFDSSGNASRISDPMIVVYNEPPSVPTGLSASIENHNVYLSWNANAELDISGYNIYRNGQKTNASITVTSGMAEASSGNYTQDAFDGNPDTYWESQYGYGMFNPAWLEIDMSSAELINRVEVHWGSGTDPDGNEIIYAGKNYEIQVWSGYAWITQATMSANNTKDNSFDFKPSYRTDKIRIHITDTADPDDSKQVRISEVKIFRDNLSVVASYDDAALPDNKYKYNVSAVDYYGFESPLSTEIEVTVGDMLPPQPVLPSKPEIYSPTVSGSPVVSLEGKINILGNADPGSVVELFSNGSSVGKTTAAQEDIVQSFSLGNNAFYMELSPDGKKLAYKLSGSMWIKDLISGGDTRVTQNLYSFIWSPDGKKLAYEFRDNNWNRRIGIYDAGTGSTALLTEDDEVYERQPSWSSDGNRIAFRSDRAGDNDIWLKDLVEGSYVQVTSDIDVYAPLISPDGKKVAYSSYNYDTDCDDVYVKDIYKTGAILVDASCPEEIYFNWASDSKKISLDIYGNDGYSNIFVFDTDTMEQKKITAPGNDDYSPVWSPDANKLAFVSYDNAGNASIFVLDTETMKQTKITGPDYDDFNPVWSPDSKFIVFEKWDSGSSNSMVIVPSDGQDTVRVLKQNLDDYAYIAWTKSGTIAYTNQSMLNVTYLKGGFDFKDVQLDLGENVFYATAADSQGHVSQPSDPISVTFSSNLVPDIEVTTGDIIVYPQYPKPGEEALVYVTVWNKGGADATDVEADIYLLDSEDGLVLVKSEKITRIAAGLSEMVGIDLNSLKSGTNRVFAVIDPQDNIGELEENNNYAEKEIVVGEAEGILMSTALDSDRYQAGQNVSINLKFDNAGVERNATIAITVEDKAGYVVTTLYNEDKYVPYAFHQDIGLSWNTGNTFAGQYSVHSVLKDTSGILAENVTPFSILPELDIDLSVTTDKAGYGPFEGVSLNTGLKNRGKNYIVPVLTAKIKITDQNNNILFTDDKTFTNVLPDIQNTISTTWNSGLNPPGMYNASAAVYIDDNLISSKTTVFAVNSTSVITGEVTASPAVVVYGNMLKIGYKVQNTGNTASDGIKLNMLLIEPETQAIVSTADNSVDLPVNGSRTGEFTFSTQSYGLKTYTAILQSVYQNDTKILASTSFTVKDGIPPAVNVISPAQGSYYSSKLEISVAAVDDVSGVDKVEYQMDGGSWKLLPLSNASTGRYSTTWVPTMADEGNKILSFRSMDKAGNISQPVQVFVTVDMTPPEPPVITSPEDNAFIVSEMVDIRGIAEPGSTVAMSYDNVLTAKADPSNGEFVFEGVILALGKNEFVFNVSDIAGNTSEPAAYALNFLPLNTGVAADKMKYNPYETISITMTMQNISSEYTLQGLTAKVSILNGLGQAVFVDEKQVQTLVPGQLGELKSFWNTSNSTKGIYCLKFEILKDSIVQTNSSTAFEILGSSQTGEGITGTLAVQPAPVFQGKDVTISYSITNKGNEDIGALDVKILIINPDTQEIKKSYNSIIELPMSATITGSFISNTSDLVPRTYLTVLQISAPAMTKAKEAATTVFEVKPGLETTKTIPDVVNMLVWVNDKCHEHEKDKNKYLPGPPEKGCQHHDNGEDDDTCLRIDLLEKVLMESTGDYYIVHSKKDFQAELRNPYYTDILILGDDHYIEDHYSDELRERVYSGTGLITSLWLNNDGENKGRMFGVKYKGKLSGENLVVNTVQSPITSDGIIYAKGEVENIDVTDDAVIAAWTKKVKEYNHKKKEEYYPVVVLNEYGKGRTIYFAFDLGSTLNESSYDSLAGIVKSSIIHVHRQADTTTFYPEHLVPFELQFKGLIGASDLRIKETYPMELKLYDPAAGKWVADNPWTINIHLEPDGPKNVLFYALTPDKAGTYTLQSEVGFMDNGNYSFNQNLSADITVSKDSSIAVNDVIGALNALSVSLKDKQKLKDSVKYMKNVQKRVISTAKDIEKNIQDILKTAESLLTVTSTDVSAVRLLLDELLRIWEGRAYFE